ncbi:hypothetical protein CAPTEDRAFT_139957, partial [Capitella teleta]
AAVCCDFQPGDLVWAKLEGYPWWASLVTRHPKSGSHVKQERSCVSIHVQFFDDPPSRGWVKAKNAKAYTGSDCKEFQRGGVFFSSKPECQNAAQEADNALGLDREDRLKQLVVALDSSSEEEEEEEDEPMDGDLYLQTPKKSPIKSPLKKTRSGRQPKTKKRRIIENNSDEDLSESEDDFKPGIIDSSSDDESEAVESSEPDTASESESPVKSQQKRKRNHDSQPSPMLKPSRTLQSFMTPSPKPNSEKPFTPSVGDRTISKLAAFSAPDTPSTPSAEDGRVYPHMIEDFLQPGKMRDAEKRTRDHPEYDARTIYVPDAFLNKQTPAMRQWWQLKAKHFDTILFFKMGKFYELFHMDATIAVNELGLIYMKGEQAHAGFPEIAYGRYAETLIQKGYKVGRIEQTETPDMVQERVRKSEGATKYDKVVARELCSVQTKGTKRYSFLDGDSGETSSAHLLAVKEVPSADNCSSFGVCFIDTSVGTFHVGQFTDDRHQSRLRTLTSHYPVVQVLFERGNVSERLNSFLGHQMSAAIREPLKPNSQFWDGSRTLKELSEGSYFTEEESPTAAWPEALKAMQDEADPLGKTPREGSELALSALGAVIWYLRESLIDHELISMRNFEVYHPLDSEAKEVSDFTNKKMVLDGVTLNNLEILQNGEGGTEGTLLDHLNRCSTPFGKRLFQQWLCAPSCQSSTINDRLDAVEDLMALPDLAAEAQDFLRKLPDLERLLSKIHTLGSAKRSQDHPDSRAIFFEDVAYSKRKIEDFLSALAGFALGMKIAKLFSAKDVKAKLLKKTVTLDCNGGRFPDLTEQLDFFEQSFDQKKAKTEGVIKPSKGVDPDYDFALSDMKLVQQQLDDYLDKQKSRLGCRNIVFWGSGKNRFQMEIPEGVAKKVPNEYELTSSKKGHKRYRTREIERLLAQMVDAEERRDVALRDVMRRIFAQFDKHAESWNCAVQCLSLIDVLICLSEVSKGADMVRPEVHQPITALAPFLEIREGRHPCISRSLAAADFIPNDTCIGGTAEDSGEGNGRLVLVTGPNMGGKSTLMRQVGCLVIMAHLGCYVPAEKCALSVVDRVFTRLGASDRIMAGESTFFVELSETSSILQHASAHSLVLLDELGSGTATYDGTAIACAVVRELCERRCRTLFSTHYHSLVEEFSSSHDASVRLGHMACMVEEAPADDTDSSDPSEETVTFLYKFVSGACPKSYGFNAAKLAGIPSEVISRAVGKSRAFESTIQNLSLFRLRLTCFVESYFISLSLPGKFSIVTTLLL